MESKLKDDAIHAPTNTDNKIHLGLSRDIEVASSPCSSFQSNFLLLLGQVLLHIALSTLENNLSLRLGRLQRKRNVSNAARNSGASQVQNTEKSVPKDG